MGHNYSFVQSEKMEEKKAL
ncbi:uncharacterized protein G2W53_005968 [Senna tora]|uniref:Uncharacterized protein n=1 Tax=Senna tora TaxID=362788 RepID=A0A834X365_9FABA|nr:uncharacterized protein G2W53_005968 [Senna tora]